MFLAHLQLARLWIRTNDPWAAISHPVPFRYFGLGSKREFEWYLDGRSTVAVASVEEIKRWLLNCAYQRDEILFKDPDFWQHPSMFERLRKGDCEDHAIWAWRKLKDLGIPARFFTGRVLAPVNGGRGYHAWVVFEHDSKSWLFETVAFHVERMVLPLDEVRSAYIPHFSVDHALSIQMYCGYAKTRGELGSAASPLVDPA